MLGSFGALELALILVMVLIVFGVGKLPELGSGLGEGIRNFKKSYRDSKAIDVSASEATAGNEDDESAAKKTAN